MQKEKKSGVKDKVGKESLNKTSDKALNKAPKRNYANWIIIILTLSFLLSHYSHFPINQDI